MHALGVLEFQAILARLADLCETQPGRLICAGLTPSFDPVRVEALRGQTAEALHLLDRGGLSLRGLRDVAGSLDYARKEGVLDGQSLFWIAEALRVAKEAKAVLQPKRESCPRLQLLAERITPQPALEQRLHDALESDGSVRSAASAALASAREKKSRLQQRMQERIQSYVSGKTREWLSDPVVTQRSGRLVIPLKAENKGKIKGIIHDTSATGQTVYLEPEDVVRLGNEVREAEAAERAEVEKVLRALSGRVGAVAEPTAESVEALADLDAILAKARLGLAMKGCVPRTVPGPRIRIRLGVHPLLDQATAVPLTLELGAEHLAILITGPNTGGKTVSIKAVGLFVAMGQCGMMLPAAEVDAGVFTQIWADIGDEQSLQQSLSTFSGHIKNISEALAGCKEGALVLLDEVGAGTDPAEGAALAKAILREFRRKGARVLASTHYGELKVFASTEPGFTNACMEFDRKSLRPTYRLLMGLPGSSHAMRIAERYGIPSHVVREAEAGEGLEERDLAQMIEGLERSQKSAQAAQSRADRLAKELDQVRAQAAAALEKAEETRHKVRSQAVGELEEALRLIRLEAAEVFEQVKKDPAGLEAGRRRLKELQEVGQEFVRDMRPAPPKAPSGPQKPSQTIERGMTVALPGISQNGVVLEDPKGGKVVVQVGPMKMTVKLEQLQVVKQAGRQKPSRSPGTISKAATATHELHLRALRADEAQDELEKFLDDAVLGGVPFVRIVHGKGDGILRQLTHAALRKHPQVRSFRDGEPQEGGHGVTIADLA